MNPLLIVADNIQNTHYVYMSIKGLYGYYKSIIESYKLCERIKEKQNIIYRRPDKEGKYILVKVHINKWKNPFKPNKNNKQICTQLRAHTYTLMLTIYITLCKMG